MTQTKEEAPDKQLERSLALFDAYIKNTPKEKLDEIIREVECVGTKGPTVEEYFQGVAQDYYTIAKENVELKAKISHLQATLEVADEIMDLLKLRDAQNGTLLPFRQEQLRVAREKYQQLKTKSQS